jgi:hypothetical protein
MIRRIIFITVVCAFVAAPALAVHMGTATFQGVDPGGAWWGAVEAGQYNLTTWGLGVIQGDGVQFGTFSLEWSEPIELGVTYDADVSNAAIYGAGPKDGETISDPLDPRSAYLYDQYLKGNLHGCTADTFQVLIWAFEDELPWPTEVTPEVEALALLAENCGWSDTGSYRVMNLWNPDGSRAMDFIVRVPVPAASMTLISAVDTINTFAPETFKNKNLGNVLTNKINAVRKSIDQGDYTDAIDKLRKDILERTNGCAETGAPDTNDWIVTSSEQEQLYPLILEAIKCLEEAIQ